MPDEIDRLEIAIEAEANNANRALSGMEKRLNKVATALEKVMIMAQGGLSFENVDVSKLFAGNAINKAAKKAGKDLSDGLISGFNLNKADADVQRQVKSLVGKISGELAKSSGKPYAGINSDMEQLAKTVTKNGSIAKETLGEYKELYETIKGLGKIKIHPDTAKSLGDSYKDRSGILRQKLSTSSEGTELDSIYGELREKFPSILKDVNNVEDEFYQLNDAVKRFLESANAFEKPEWLESSAYESVVDGVENITKSIQNAKNETEQLTESMHGIKDTGKSFSELFGAGMDTSGLEKATALIKDATHPRSNGPSNARANRTDLKYPAKSLKELQNQFKDSRLEVDFSSKGGAELRSEIQKNERAFQRMKQAIADKVSLSGTDELGGKDWYRSIMQMNQYENAIFDATEALGKLESKQKEVDFSIERGENSNPVGPANTSKKINSKSMDYDAGAMKAVFGDGAKDIKNFNDLMAQTGKNGFEAAQAINEFDGKLQTSNVNTFEAQIKSLKSELAELSAQGFSQYDPEYDTVAKKLAMATAAKKQYDATMRNNAKVELGEEQAKATGNALENATKKANLLSRAFRSISNSAKSINSVKKSFGDISKAIQNAKSMATKAIHPFRTLKELMSGTGNQGSKGMSWGRMIGSSLMFSTIFGAISQIKEAIKAGSDNLVQYSDSYNKSISGMVTSLLYLKNAWAVAFAPIINVVGPYISKFIDMIAGALNAVGQFMAALTGKGYTVQAKKAWMDYGQSIQDTSGNTKKAADNTNKANKAAKEFKKTIMGFDELNVLTAQDTSSDTGNTPSSSGGTGTSGKYTGPSTSEMFDTVEVSNSMKDLAQMFKDAAAKSDFTDIGRMISDKLANALESINWQKIYHCADNFGKDLATFLNGLITPRLFYDLGATVAGAINTAFHALNSFAVNFDWANFGTSLAKSIKGFFENWDAGLTAQTFSNFGKGILEALTAFVEGLVNDKTFETIGQKLVDFICGVDWAGLTWDLAKFFSALADALIKLPEDFARGVAQRILDKIFGENNVKLPKVKWFDNLIDWVQELNIRKIPIMNWILDFVDLTELFINMKKAFDKVTEKMKKNGENVTKGLGEGILAAFGVLDDWIEEHFPLVKAFKSLFGIHSPSTVFEELGGYIMDGLSNGITGKMQPILDFFDNMKTSITEKFNDIGDWFGDKFGKARKAVENKFSDVGTWFSNRKSDIQSGLKDVGDWIGSKFSSGRKNVNSSFQDVGTWFGSRKTDIQNGTKDIDTWMLNKYNVARQNVNSKFQDIGTWFTNRKSDIQNGQDSISSWFSTKYQNARSNVNGAFQNVGTWFGNRRSDIQSSMQSIVAWFSSTFQRAYNAITGTFSNIGSYFSRIGENIKSPIRNALNGVISGVNWVLDRLGSKKQFSYVNFATGTGKNGVTQDTLGVVNDQAGGTYREMVQFPNGKTIIPKGRNVMLPMPKGTKVLPANKTAALMQSQNIPHFKSGIGDFFGGAWAKFKDFTGDVLDYVEHPKKLMQIAIDKFTDFSGVIEPGLSMAKGAVNTVFDSAVSKIKGLLSDFGSVKYNPSSGVEQWRNLAKRALTMTGQYSEANLNRLLMQMQSESGGNPNAINNWDINAKKGTPSKGLMQVIDPTFRAYALAPHNKNIYDPLSNMLAAIRYTVARYGSLAKGWKGHGYELGGFPKNGEVYVANENGFGSEMIGKMGNRNVVANNQQITDGIKEAVIDAMMQVYMATTASGQKDDAIPYIINAVLKTEDNEVLARAVEKGRASRDGRFNPSPAY